MMQAGIRTLPGVVIIGGGLVVESGGSLVGAIGVSGGPGGDADEACAKAGSVTIAIRPSVGQDGGGYRSDVGQAGTEIFLQTGLDC